jgi:hypothetical protein
MQVTRRQLINEINRRQPDQRPIGNSYSAWGAQRTWDRAMRLLGKLERGDAPTTAQVVGYFGAGAQFMEDE